MNSEQALGAVIVVGNQKGGVGKSTNSCHIAAALGERGHACLIIDLDPHAGATHHLGVRPKSYAGTLELLTTDESIQSLAITDGLPAGVHLIPARPELAELRKLVSKYLHPTRLLDRPLQEARGEYDFIFLDTPPSAQDPATIAAYSSADWMLLSAFPEQLSVEGLIEAFHDIRDVRELSNPHLEVLGVVLTRVDRRLRHSPRRIQQLLGEALPGREFSAFTAAKNALPDVSERGHTLFDSKRYRDDDVTHQYRCIALDIEHRAKNRAAFLAGTLESPDYESILGAEVARVLQSNDVHEQHSVVTTGMQTTPDVE